MEAKMKKISMKTAPKGSNPLTPIMKDGLAQKADGAIGEGREATRQG